MFGWDSVDAGGGWLIFALPPTEMGVHPHDGPMHQISMMCDDLEATMARATALGSRVLMEIQELPDTRIAVVTDPEGNPVGLCADLVKR